MLCYNRNGSAKHENKEKTVGGKEKISTAAPDERKDGVHEHFESATSNSISIKYTFFFQFRVSVYIYIFLNDRAKKKISNTMFTEYGLCVIV